MSRRLPRRRRGGGRPYRPLEVIFRWKPREPSFAGSLGTCLVSLCVCVCEREREREREEPLSVFVVRPNTPGLPAVAEGVRIPFPSFQTGSPFEQSSTRTFPVASRPTTTSPSLTESPPSSPARRLLARPLRAQTAHTWKKREWPRIIDERC